MSRFSKLAVAFAIAGSIVVVPSLAIAKTGMTGAPKKTSKATATSKKSSPTASASSSSQSQMDQNRAAMKKKSAESKRTGKM